MANLAISNYGNDKWMPKLLRSRRLWGETLRGSKRKTRINGNSPAIRYYLSSHLTLPLDFQTLAQQFEQWANSTFNTELGEWIAIDGKCIKGTVTEPGTAYQNFISLVLVYSSRQGVVLKSQQFESKHNSELKVVQTMLEALHLEGVVFTMDALHCRATFAGEDSPTKLA